MPTLNTYIEIPVTVEFEYDPGQELIRNPPDLAQEGFPASVTLLSIKVMDKRKGDVDISNVTTPEQDEQLISECFAEIELCAEADPCW